MIISMRARTGTFCCTFPEAGVISKGSKLPCTIKFDDDAKEYHKLCKEVKEVLEIIIGLIKDKAANDEPDRKKTKIEGYHSKE